MEGSVAKRGPARAVEHTICKGTILNTEQAMVTVGEAMSEQVGLGPSLEEPSPRSEVMREATVTPATRSAHLQVEARTSDLANF
eukprot:2944896-Amphidinium_carterae.1